MSAYQPSPPNPADLPRWLDREHRRIASAMEAPRSFVPMTYLTQLPARAQDGLYLAASGVLGASRGLYRYDSATTTYTFIG